MGGARADGPLKAQPDPVRSGGVVTVTYTGSGQVRYRTDGGWKSLPIDPKTKRGRVRVPPGAKFLTFADDRGNSIFVEVLETST